MSDPLSRSDLLAGRQVALAHSAVVLAVAAGLQTFPPDHRTALVLAVSTGPDAVLQDPVRCLLLRPFGIPTATGLWLLPGVVVSVAAVQGQPGMVRAALMGLHGHAAVSAVVAVLLERDDDAPRSAAAVVGVGYVLGVTAGMVVGHLLAWLTGPAVTGAVRRRRAEPCST